jgi:hypothetical protein
MVEGAGEPYPLDSTALEDQIEALLVRRRC